jgi:hypothetical protein
MMPRKFESGAQKRKKRRERAAANGVVLMEAPYPTLSDVSSLTALTSTRLRFLVEWFKKRLSTDDFAVFLKTLAEFRADAVARIQERTLENDEKAVALAEAHEARMAGLTMMPSPALEQSPGPAGGELVPRETKTDEVSE